MTTTNLRLGSVVPDFTAETTQGVIHFHDWIGSSWAILFSHPGDFTPVCTTELGAVQRLVPRFQKRNVKVIGLSVDSVKDHLAWIDDINEVNNVCISYPIIADQDRSIATAFGMLDHADHDATNIAPSGLPLTVRSVFIIDPKKTVRLIITYPASCGRHFDEIIRVVDSLQLTDTQTVTTPANWIPGKEVIVHPAVKTEDAIRKFGKKNVRVLKPYLRLLRLTKKY